MAIEATYAQNTEIFFAKLTSHKTLIMKLCILAVSKWKLIYFINTQYFDNFILYTNYSVGLRPNGASNLS